MFCDSENCRQINEETIRIQDAVIEDIVSERRSMLVTISYLVMEDNIMVANLITLVVSANTEIEDCSRRNLTQGVLRIGMSVNALLSTRMTRSIPPQARAYVITILDQVRDQAQIKTGRIISIDVPNRLFVIGMPWNINEQMVFHVTEETQIYNRNGRRIGLWMLLPGMNVRVEHADFQTLSIPPQSTAYVVQVV